MPLSHLSARILLRSILVERETCKAAECYNFETEHKQYERRRRKRGSRMTENGNGKGESERISESILVDLTPSRGPATNETFVGGIRWFGM